MLEQYDVVYRPLAAAKCTGVAPSHVLHVMGHFADLTIQCVMFNRPVWAAACKGVIPSLEASCGSVFACSTSQ